MKTAVMFPGQGSQYAGMGKELYEAHPEFRKVFDAADMALGFPLTEICFGEDARLNETEYAQPAIVAHSLACLSLLRSRGFDGDAYFGLSLGEYAAVCAAGALDFEQTITLVKKRGGYMSEAAKLSETGMSAILGLSAELCEKACAEASHDGCVVCANYNMPGQIVISGELSALSLAEQYCVALGAKRVMRLNVSGAFHSRYMTPAAAKLAQELNSCRFSDFSKPIITNAGADYLCEKEKLADNFLSQLISPVRFEQGVRRLILDGYTRLIELGPGRALCGFVRRTDSTVIVLNIEDCTSFEKTICALGGLV